jgi:hypothetical protein
MTPKTKYRELRRSLEELVLLAKPFTEDVHFNNFLDVTLGKTEDWIALRAAVHRSTQLLNNTTPE